MRLKMKKDFKYFLSDFAFIFIEYLKAPLKSSPKDSNKMFALIIGITSFSVILLVLILSFLAYKWRKESTSGDSSGELREGSQVKHPLHTFSQNLAIFSGSKFLKSYIRSHIDGRPEPNVNKKKID